MFGFIRSVPNLARLLRIGLTLVRHDALFPITALGNRVPSAPLLSATRSLRRRGAATARPGERLAAAFAELGPSFIKLGQILATRADLLGDEITEDLALLQDRLPPFSGQQARALIEAEFEQPLGSLFRSFDETAVAAASIAQVHFAVTTDGREVAVKVLRPGIARAFARDIDLFMTELFDKAYRQTRDRRRPIRKRGKRRAAHSGYIKNDRFGLFQRSQEWLGKFPIRADSIEYQERRPASRPALDGDLQKLAAHLDHLHVNIGRKHLAIHNCIHLKLLSSARANVYQSNP